MNPHQNHPTSLVAAMASAARHRGLIAQLAKRDVIGRYRGSLMGLAWSFLNPVLMLAIYTFVFSIVFRTRWGGPADDSLGSFAIVLFTGLLVHGLFAECVNRAPSLVLAQPNLVKKVVFPLEILPWVSLGSALFHTAASLAVLFVAQLLVHGRLPWTSAFLPVVFVPLVVLVMGLSWILSAIGVFLRDISQAIGMVTSVLLFMSPVFYPASALSERYRAWLYLNPLTPIIEDARNTLIFGQLPDFSRLFVVLVVGIVVAQVGFWVFQRTRRGFADVV